MKRHRSANGFALGAACALALVASCAAVDQGVAPPASAPAGSGGPLGSPFADRSQPLAYPLLLDRGDLSLGTTVQFARMPTLAEISDLGMITALRHVVISLPSWPPEYAPLQVLQSLPPEADAVVVLAGYPPSRGAAEAWNLLSTRIRLVVVVRDPPPSSGLIADLNNLRALERVIVETDYPARTGFEQLQRPLSFRMLRE